MLTSVGQDARWRRGDAAMSAIRTSPRGSVARGQATSALLRPNRHRNADRGKALLLPHHLYLPVSV
jgi:hypothetical protein